MSIVYTWEMHNGPKRLNFVMVDDVMFSLIKDGGFDAVYRAYPGDIAAREGAVRITGYSEEDGYTLNDGIWVCDIEVNVPELKAMIDSRDRIKGVKLLNNIVIAAHIMGRRHI